jgi:hypothetical protein
LIDRRKTVDCPQSINALLLLFGLLVVLVLTACGDDDDDPSPTADFADAAREAVPVIPLTTDDMPPNWETADAPISDSVELSDGCDIFGLDVVFPEATATATGDALSGGLQQQLLSFGAIYHDPDEAQSALEDTRVVVDRCREEFEDEVRRLAEQELQALGIDLGIFADIDASIEEMDVDLDADGGLAYRVAVTVGIPGADQHFTLDVFLVREGRAVGAVTYATFGQPNLGDEALITESLIDHTGEAEEMLPAS